MHVNFCCDTLGNKVICVHWRIDVHICHPTPLVPMHSGFEGQNVLCIILTNVILMICSSCHQVVLYSLPMWDNI